MFYYKNIIIIQHDLMTFPSDKIFIVQFFVCYKVATYVIKWFLQIFSHVSLEVERYTLVKSASVNNTLDKFAFVKLASDKLEWDKFVRIIFESVNFAKETWYSRVLHLKSPFLIGPF